MNSKLNVMLAALAGLCAWNAPVHAQNTFIYAPVPPATKLEMFETNTGTVLIKSAAVIGSMSISGGSVSVTCKEDAEPATGRKEYGIIIALALEQTPASEDRTVVDYEELDSLLKALDALATIDWSVSSLASFDAVYQTKGGFKIAAFSVRRSGTVEHSLRSSRMTKKIVITSSQWAEFRGLIDQARRKIEELRGK